MPNSSKGVLVIYTGGTIGSKPRDEGDPDSPQFVVDWEELKEATPELARLPFPIDCYSFAKPLDSCDVGPAEWAEMADAIAKNYDNYEGFVILHGTDTMVYTASALSFMLRDLGKPVVITGAQRSAMVDVRNDATQNFINALHIANPGYSRLPVIPEVVICFGGLILRGNRTIKKHTSDYQAYESPNIPPLGTAGNRILIDERILRPRPEGKRFRAITKLETRVAPIFVFPGIQNTDLVQRQLADQNLRAAIVHAYGSGDIPTNREFLNVFEEAHARGVILVACTQCGGGDVELGIYDTSAMLLAAGFISAHDITKEAAQCKLMTLLGDPDITTEEAEALFMRNLAGEQSRSTLITRFPSGSNARLVGPEPDGGKQDAFRIPGRPLEGENWSPFSIQKAILRLRGAEMPGAQHEAATIRIFLNADEGDILNAEHGGYAGTFRKYWNASVPVLTFDITATLRPIASPGARVSFTLAIDTPGVTCSWKSTELALIVSETAGGK